MRIKAFITAYNAEYGLAPENAFAALGYDTVYLLADAIKRAGGMDGPRSRPPSRPRPGSPASPGPSPSRRRRTCPRRA